MASWWMRTVATILAPVLGGMGATLVSAPRPLVAARASGPGAKSGLYVSRDMFGVNVGTWDQQLADPSSVTLLRQLGLGFQQFPNPGGVYNWQTNQALSPRGQWNPQPVSLDRWGKILAATGMHGLYLVPYGYNPQGTAGETVADVQALTRYLVDHHLPVSAMVIGAEENLSGTLNLHRDKTPQRYAALAAQMAQAIHAIDPAMRVGVDLAVPENPSQPDPNDLAWNRTVLTVTAPYVQFVSAHVYPLPVVQTDSLLLQSLHRFIKADMAFIRRQLQADAGAYASRIQVWITEFNPYNGASAQSLRPVFAAAAVESLLLWADYGAAKVFWWSLHGDAKAPVATGQPVSATYLVSKPGAPFGTFGLASEAIAPQPKPLNRLYPAGAGIAQLMALIGRGATVTFDERLYRHHHLLAFSVDGGSGTRWIVINARHIAQSLDLGGARVTLPPAAMTVVKAAAPPRPVTPAPELAAGPRLERATLDAASGVLTIAGSGFGDAPPLVPAESGGYDQPRLKITDVTTGASYGWLQPGERDWFGIAVESWTPNRIRVHFPTAAPAPTDTLRVSFWKDVAGIALRVAKIGVGVKWLDGAPAPPTITRLHWLDARTLQIDGSGFGARPDTVPAGGGGVDQGVLAIYDNASHATYGWVGHGTTDYYGLAIRQWTAQTIVVRFVATPPAAGDPLTVSFPGLAVQAPPIQVPGA